MQAIIKENVFMFIWYVLIHQDMIIHIKQDLLHKICSIKFQNKCFYDGNWMQLNSTTLHTTLREVNHCVVYTVAEYLFLYLFVQEQYKTWF